jgi:hypothetical protein
MCILGTDYLLICRTDVYGAPSSTAYLPSFLIAIDDINNDSSLLTTTRLAAIWNDTLTNLASTLAASLYQSSVPVTALIGPDTTARTEITALVFSFYQSYIDTYIHT